MFGDFTAVTELTLVLLSLAGSNKGDVIRQIQCHLRGVCIDEDDDLAERCSAEAEQEVPLKRECQGKVLGLCVTAINMPDVTDDEENNRTLGDEIQKFVTDRNCVVVMVIQSEDGEEEREEIEMKQLWDFTEMVLGEEAEKYVHQCYKLTHLTQM